MSPTPDAKQLFLDALELPEDARSAYLERACGGDAALLDRARALLDAHASAHEHVPEARVGAAPVGGPGAVLGLKPGLCIGHYTLVRSLGEGGFGTVWVAEQAQPVARRVALKVLKPAAVSREALERFHEERRLLARMQHEGIATLFDGGTTESGLPWFAMELVEGTTITRYCRERDLSVAQRVELLLRTCAAVQHAHQKGVVHRDLKPSNVLVAEVDGRPVPKVIDFGIAKLVDESGPGGVLETRTGLVMGTPAFLSPEQIDDSSDVDTRSDVYALGVLLYELLADVRPLDDEILRAASLIEILRMIREVDPPRPSERLQRAAATRSGAARTASLERARRVAGDLDWIAMRCLCKDREERYPSVAVLAQELERHLAGQPVQAGPPHVSYRVRKFARRHRGALAAAGAFLVLLVGATAVSITLAVRARRAEGAATREARHAAAAERDALGQAAAAERARAEAAAQALAAEQARARADTEAARARGELAKFEEIALFLQDVLHSVDPAVAQGKDRTLLREILDRATRRIDTVAADVPEVEGALRHTIALSYYALALYEPAEPQLRRAVELYLETLGEEHEDTLTAMNDLGGLCGQTGRVEEAREWLERAFEGRTRVLGPEHEDTLLSLNNLATVRKLMGELDEAEAMHREILDIQTRVHGPDADGAITAMNNLAGVLELLGRTDEALELYGEALAANLRTHGPTHPHTLATHNNLGFMYQKHGELHLAAPHLERAIEIKREILEPEHPSLMISLNNLAELTAELGRTGEAEELYREALAIATARVGEADERTHGLRLNYARFLLAQRRPVEALPLLEAAEAGLARLFADDNALLVATRGSLLEARRALELGG